MANASAVKALPDGGGRPRGRANQAFADGTGFNSPVTVAGTAAGTVAGTGSDEGSSASGELDADTHIFVGDLGSNVTDAVLHKVFSVVGQIQ